VIAEAFVAISAVLVAMLVVCAETVVESVATEPFSVVMADALVAMSAVLSATSPVSVLILVV